jgi:hypothetical protein
MIVVFFIQNEYLLQGNGPQSVPFGNKKTLNAPPTTLDFISPASPGALLKFPSLAKTLNMLAAAVVTNGRPRQACGPQP